jgi:hypothetical protein
LAGHIHTNGEYTTNNAAGKEEKGKILISVGPAKGLSSPKPNNAMKWELQYVKEQLNWNAVDAANWDIIKTDPAVVTKLNNVNGKILGTFTDRLSMSKNLNGGNSFKYGLLKGCVNYNARALFRAGVFNVNALLPVTAPLLLNAELGLRQFGIYASPYLIKYE